MDFHALTRKELQALCKKNKIPANITNVAMADALQSLEQVEGLDELLNSTESCEQHSPEKTENGAIEVPRTAGRTSTRRTAKEPPSAQPITQTRRTTRRTAQIENGEENKFDNLSNTPAIPTTRRRAPARSAIRKMDTKLMDAEDDVGQEKSGMAETPAISTRGKAPAVSARRKTESKKLDTSVLKVYSTRRSVRLLEEGMDQLTLEGTEGTEPVKMADLSEEMAEGAEVIDNNIAGTELKEQSKDSVTTADITVTEDELKDDKEEFKGEAKLNGDLTSKNSVNEDNLPGSVANGKQNEEANLDADLTSETSEKEDIPVSCADKVNEEASDDSTHFDGNTEEIIDDKIVENDIEFSDESEKTNEMLQVEKQTEMVTSSTANSVHDEGSVQVTIVNTAAEGSNLPEVENVGEVYVDDQSIKMEDLVDAEVIEAVDLAGSVASKYDMDLEDSADVVATELVAVTAKYEDIQKEEDEKETVHLMAMNSATVQSNLPEDEKVYEIKDQSIKMEDLVDAVVTEPSDFAGSSMLPEKPINSSTDLADSDNLADVDVIPEVEFTAPTFGNIPSEDQEPALKEHMTPQSPLESLANTASEQTSVALSSVKSAIKDQVTVWEMPPLVTDNKENIQIISSKDNENHKAKKELKSWDEKTLEDLSIRQLTKLLKEKLQITNNEPIDVKDNVGKPRQALQAVPSNIMTGNENKLN